MNNPLKHHLGKKTLLACIISLASVSYANATTHSQNITQYPPKALLAQITAPVTGELYKTKLTAEQQQIVDQAKLEKKMAGGMSELKVMLLIVASNMATSSRLILN